MINELYNEDIQDMLEEEARIERKKELEKYTPIEKSQLADLELWYEDCLSEKDNYLNWGWPVLSNALMGACGGTSILIAGAPNSGKSQLQTSLVIQLLNNNDDVVLVDFTLDDTKKKRFTQYVSNLSNLEMNTVDFANKIRNPDKRKRFEEASNKVLKWIGSNKLFMYENFSGDTNQANLAWIHKKLVSIRNTYKDKKLVVILDSLNDVDPPKKSEDSLEESKVITQLLNKTITANNALLISSTHLRKVGGKRPTLEDVKGNNFLAYSAKAVIGVYNDVKINKEKAKVVWQDKQGEELIKMPIVEAHFLKSKVSDFNGCIPMLQWPAIGKVQEPEKEVQSMLCNLIYKGA